MLKRKGNNVVDSLHWYGQRIAWKSFTDDESDAAEGIAYVPLSLLKNFLLKSRELECLKISILGETCLELVGSLEENTSFVTKAARNDMRPIALPAQRGGTGSVRAGATKQD